MLKPFFIWQDKVLKSIDPEKVFLLLTEGNYTKIWLVDEANPYLVRCTLADALSKLPSDIFIQVSRSIAASIFYIDYIDKDHLVMLGQAVPIGKQYYKALVEKLDVIE